MSATVGKTIRFALLAGGASLSVTGLAAPLAAQELDETSSSDADNGNGNVILVTAQKRSQDIQDVPIAISVFDGSTIDDKVIDDAVDLSFSVPNLTVDQFGASLRGVGNLAISSTSEAGLGFHVNGVYLGSAATEAEFYDLERIEVLRGPQGTLYGRNTTAGVLNIITQKATDEFEGYVTAGYGNFNSIKLRGAINVPLSDNLSTRVAGFYLDRDGYATNLFTGNDVDNREMFGVRSSTRLDLGDTRADLVVSYFREDDRRHLRTKVQCVADATLGCSPLETGFEVPNARSTIFSAVGSALGLIVPGSNYFDGSLNPADTRLLNEDVDPSYFVEEWQASLEIEHSFGDITLTSLSGYSELERDSFRDFDRFVSTATLPIPVTFDFFGDGSSVTSNSILAGRRDQSEAREYYQELRLASDFDGPLNFILGGNYYDRRSSGRSQFTSSIFAVRQQVTGLSTDFASLTNESDPSTTKSFGIFGEVYFDLSDRTRITGGLRYSDDKKTILTRQIFFNPQADGSVPDFTFGEFERGVVTGRFVVDHRFSDDLLGYASFSRGYKAGGINPGEVDVELQGFDPEFLTAYEVGLKGATSDGTLTASLAGFYYDYEGLQLGQTTPTAARTVNSDATVWGVEAEFALRPSSRFQVDGSFSYLNTEINGFQSIDETDPFGVAPGTVIVGATPAGVIKDADGNPLPFSPTIKIAIGAQWEIPVGAWTVTPRIDHYLQSEFVSSAFDKPIDRFDGYGQTDFKVLLAPDDGPFEIRGFVKNLFDNDDITRVLPAGRLVGRFREVVILEPRTYGVEATFRF
ncbi:TonB-dependent receptor [Erythrobacter sp. F6033]|uniref:TonB-dependent receptor n=1 Tax=Erythrobacter sp. F6033 TaxID=2926401 RepID=UPI001FF26F11|nr:TonB-dependent receptor [Erythrobacter sp. F6033]MCK0127552.1 TonB-dependent receptor [Erythrobacter sp. F6033]